jgi:hypothetical protein
MPIIPTPPQMTLSQKIQAIQGITNQAIQNVNIVQPNSNVAQQIKDVAEQQARMVLDEWMKQHKDLFDSKERKLKIKNPNAIVGYSVNPHFSVVGVIEEDKYYQFTLNSANFNQNEIILLHRRQTDSGHYIMEYNGKTMWVTKDEIDRPEKIVNCMQVI